MPAKRLIIVFCLFSLLPLSRALADTAPPSYVELQDAPTIIVDWSKGNTQAVTLHGDRKIVFENGVKGGRYLLVVTQDATGARTISWPSTVQWPGPVANPTPPQLTTTANKKDFAGFFFDGEHYDAISLSQNF